MSDAHVVSKEELKDFLTGTFDMAFEDIVRELKISKKDFPKARKYLEELEKEGWIVKSFDMELKRYEYMPGKKQGLSQAF